MRLNFKNNNKKLNVVACTCHLSSTRGIRRKIVAEEDQAKTQDPT
jgi:hypothetical protein